MQVSNKENKSLFNSIVDQENLQLVEYEIQKYAQRTGLILKVAYGRKLTAIARTFEERLTQLIKDTANAIDNELSKTE